MMNWPRWYQQSIIMVLFTVYPLKETGAEVNSVLPYSHLRKSNVIGTAEVIKFACSGGVRRTIHFISTLSVFGSISSSIPENQPLQPQHLPFLGAYGQSKFIAEQLVTIAKVRI